MDNPQVVETTITVAPSVGPTTGGTIVTLTGNGLTGATSVRFGSSPATNVVVLGDTIIQATSPSGAAGMVDVTVSGPGLTSAITSSDQFTYVVPATGSYQPLQPSRICDTRPSSQTGFTNQCNNGGAGAPLGAGETRTIQACPYPSGCTLDAVTLNVAALNATVGGFLVAFPSGTTRPNTSSLNFGPAQARAAAVEVKSSPSGGVSLYNASGSVDVIVDLEGTVDHLGGPASGSPGLLHPLIPSRICDTRASAPSISVNPCNASGNGNPLQGGQVRNIQVTGQGGVPTTGVSAVVVNATVANTATNGFLSMWPAANPQPVASNLSWAATAIVPNRVVVPVGKGGQISALISAGSADLIIDVNGWFGDGTEGPPAGTAFTAVTPVRICDTRPSSQNGGVIYPCNNGGVGAPLGSGQTMVLQVTGVGGPVPVGSQGVVATVTVTNQTTASYLTAWPSDGAQPNSTDLNWGPSTTIGNLVVVKLSASGQVSFFNQAGATDVIVDVLGYYS